MTVEQITERIKIYKQLGLKLFTTSSFQTHSMVLLHILSKIDKTIPVYFMHTGYHFPETLKYRDDIAKLFDMNIINVYSSTAKNPLWKNSDP